jgi:hypothetical protein
MGKHETSFARVERDLYPTRERRIAWFERTDGKRESPKENCAWYVWEGSVLRRSPVILYAPRRAS